jgi:hypothetical protein
MLPSVLPLPFLGLPNGHTQSTEKKGKKKRRRKAPERRWQQERTSASSGIENVWEGTSCRLILCGTISSCRLPLPPDSWYADTASSTAGPGLTTRLCWRGYRQQGQPVTADDVVVNDAALDTLNQSVLPSVPFACCMEHADCMMVPGCVTGYWCGCPIVWPTTRLSRGGREWSRICASIPRT